MAAIPDPDQQAIIHLDQGRHLVLAPPGCGKTFILAQRVIHAHNHGVDFADMLCLTFTNRASRAMRERISLHTHNPVPPDLFVGNVHRFCSNYLFDKKKIPQNSAVIDDLDSESIITHLAHLDTTRDNSHYAAYIVNLQHALSQQSAGFPKKLIVHADLLDAQDDPRWQRRAEIAKLYAQYKEADNLLDFEDLLEKAYLHALHDPDRHRYSWIQVDEVQDLNFLQLAILELFSTPEATTIYLGDEQQAIFSFVGAKLDALEELKQQCSPHLHHLGRNHRSPRYLLEIFNTYAVGQLGIDRELLPITPDTSSALPQDRCLVRACYHDFDHLCRKDNVRCPHDGKPCTRCTRAARDEYRLAVRLAQRYAALDPHGRVAIIVPTNANADRLSHEFGDTPHFKISGRDLFSSPPVQLLFSHLNVVANETCFIAWARLLYHLHVIPQYAAARNMMRQLRSCALTPTDLLLYSTSSYLQHFAQVLDEEEVVLFDTETTGLDIFHDDIIQIAAVKVSHGRYVEGSDFSIIIETQKEIPPLVGGHDNPMLSVYLNSERVGRAEGLSRFMQYCHGHTLIGHNVEFDYNILDHNIRRALGHPLGHRQRFDTLKLARLVEPRLRVYKLEKLLEILHLEGTNSHNAIDDVRATLSLLTYIRHQADHFIPTQQQLLAQPQMRGFAVRFQEAYRDLFLHSYYRLFSSPTDPPANPTGLPAVVDELAYLYSHLLEKNIIDPIDKWQHIVDFLAIDIVDASVASTFREQLERYLTDINTVRESDLCDSSSMLQKATERFFIATAHKAKGLEFDSVIIFNATEGAYPFSKNIERHDQYHLREDARRFYVALSRAKKHLCITYSEVASNGTPSHLTPFMKSIIHLFHRF